MRQLQNAGETFESAVAKIASKKDISESRVRKIVKKIRAEYTPLERRAEAAFTNERRAARATKTGKAARR